MCTSLRALRMHISYTCTCPCMHVYLHVHVCLCLGESAGGMSCTSLASSPQAKGLFHRIIAQSGAGSHVCAREFSENVVMGNDKTPFCVMVAVPAAFAVTTGLSVPASGMVYSMSPQLSFTMQRNGTKN